MSAEIESELNHFGDYESVDDHGHEYKDAGKNNSHPPNIMRFCCSFIFTFVIGIVSMIIAIVFDCNDTKIYFIISGIIGSIDTLSLCLIYVSKEYRMKKSRWPAERENIRKQNGYMNIFCYALYSISDIVWIIIYIVVWTQLSTECEESPIGIIMIVNVSSKIFYIGYRITYISSQRRYRMEQEFKSEW